MAETLRPEVVEVSCSTGAQLESKKPKSPMDKLMDDYESACHDALFRGEDDEAPFDFDVARDQLVDRGLDIVQSSTDCDRILSELSLLRYSGLWDKIYEKKISFLFTEILDQFHNENKNIVTESKSSDEDDEALEKDKCDQLRLSCVREGLKCATTQEQLQKLRGITLEKDDYLHDLIDKKAASLPIETRKS